MACAGSCGRIEADDAQQPPSVGSYLPTDPTLLQADVFATIAHDLRMLP
jgi:hypothetical protein